MNILLNKRYEINMVAYLKSLKKTTIIDKDIRDNTLKSVLNQTATFLYIKCPHCSTKLIDPVSCICKHARCGNCGYKTIL